MKQSHYRGYTIFQNPFNGQWFVHKDGINVASPTSEEQARKAVDYLTDNEI